MTYVSPNNQNFYTNLPPKTKEALDKTVEKLKTTTYVESFELNAGELDAAIAFFVKRGLTVKNPIDIINEVTK